MLLPSTFSQIIYLSFMCIQLSDSKITQPILKKLTLFTAIKKKQCILFEICMDKFIYLVYANTI